MRLMNCTQQWTNTKPPYANFEPIRIEELPQAEIQNSIFVEIRSKLKEGVQGLVRDDNGGLVRTRDKGVQIIALQSVKWCILYINH